MSRQHSIEPFPALHGHNHINHANGSTKTGGSGASRRRRSSGLGGEPRGDNAAPALATIDQSPPLTPTSSFRNVQTQEPTRGRKRRKAKSLLRRWKVISFRHTWVNPLIVVLIILSGYAVNPSPSNPLHKAIFLSYPLPKTDESEPTQYGKGAADFAFVAFYTVVLSFIREFLMQRLIRPIAIRAGIKSRGKQSRFMEQFYTAIYFGIAGPFGLYVMSRTPVWYFNTKGMLDGFPHKTLEGVFKAFYLLEASYWAQQMLVMLLMLEKPRKDFKELVMHHVITLTLISQSYMFHFTHMGLAVYITHDVSDFFIATSKILNYLDSPMIGPYYGLFIGIWAYLRHYINLKILISLLPLPNPIIYIVHDRYPDIYSMLSASIPYFFPQNPLPSTNPNITQSTLFPGWISEFATVGSYDLNWEDQQYKCWIAQLIAFSLLACLQAINMFWYFLILRIGYRFVISRGEVAKDERSEDEDEEEDVQEKGRKGVEGAPALLVNGEPMDVASGLDAKLTRQSIRERRQK